MSPALPLMHGSHHLGKLACVPSSDRHIDIPRKYVNASSPVPSLFPLSLFHDLVVTFKVVYHSLALMKFLVYLCLHRSAVYGLRS